EVSANDCDNKVINVILSSFAQFFTSFQIGVFCILLFVNIIINPPNFIKEMFIPIAKIVQTESRTSSLFECYAEVLPILCKDRHYLRDKYDLSHNNSKLSSQN
ncbi:hypothetical protein, partial [Prevotella sp.]|uniref:hypothetical protein n=1 Tax=Prevotella sp. TaxID=59823 RepID=UPI003AF97686